MRKRLWGGLVVALLAALCLMPTGAWADGEQGIKIDRTNFPDYTFREDYVRTYDADGDGYLSDAEAAKVTRIECPKKEISNLKGIEYFTALKYLYCSGNELASLDLSANTDLRELSCSSNQLTDLSVSKCEKLELLYCSSNQLTDLDVSHNAKLILLYCYSNGLTSLDVSSNGALQILRCDSNKLESLNIGSNAALDDLLCNDNALTSLDVSHCPALRKLNCSSNKLGTLNLESNTALEDLTCYSNSLAALDVSHNVALKDLGCYNNNLSTLNLRNNTALESLKCHYNALTSLDLSCNASLTELFCSYNQLGALNVSRNYGLKTLYCSYNNLTSLDVSNNAALETLNCQNNKLTSLNLNNNGALKDFDYSGNSYAILIDTGRQFALSGLPGAFDARQASNWKGGSVTDGVLTVNEDATSVTYSYYCGSMRGANFTLSVNYVVRFSTGGGSAVDSQTVAAGSNASRPASDPVWAGHVFCGWYADAECEREFNFGTAVTGATTVYAKWVEDAEAPVISGVKNGRTYCSAQTVTVADKNLDTVTVNGTVVALGEDGSFTLSPAAGEQKVVATDRAGNSVSVTVTVNDGHTWGEGWSHNTTEHWRECSVCGEKGKRGAHAGGTATCSSKAKCETCGEEHGELDPKNHEALEHVAAKAATAEAEGNTEYWRCTGCGKLFSDAAATEEIERADTVIPKLDPKKDEGGKTDGGNGGSGGQNENGGGNGSQNANGGGSNGSNSSSNGTAGGSSNASNGSANGSDGGTTTKTTVATVTTTGKANTDLAQTGDGSAAAAPLVLVAGLTALGAALTRNRRRA